MGSLVFHSGSLADTIFEQVGYKAGVVLSFELMHELLTGFEYAGLIITSEKQTIRIRSEEYEELFYKLLYRIGYTEDEYDGDYVGSYLLNKYSGYTDIMLEIFELINQDFPALFKKTVNSGRRAIDPTPLLEKIFEKYGKIGVDIATERLLVFNRGIELSPSSVLRRTEWNELQELESLFTGKSVNIEKGFYIDQRYIDFLSANPESLKKMHWRKFEELTAEYFQRKGFSVKIGLGSNDDGIDIRIWHPDETQENKPSAIIQCKRQKEKIQKIVVKGLFTDISSERADYGLIVTSSELSPGARKTILARGYPIEEVNYNNLTKWLAELRTPGTGIVRV
jgi:restriction system protein